MTTHWPHRVNDDKNGVHDGVHIPNGRETSVSDMDKGDLVFIYESKTGRAEVEIIKGEKNITRCHIGREGIVVLAEIITKPYKDEDSEPTKYIDNTEIWWRFYAKTKNINSHGFISREKVNEILGYDKDYHYRGFGTKRSGVKEITRLQYQELLKYFLKDDEKENQKLKEKKVPYKHAPNISSAPESEMHKKIKESIASNPSLYLKEPNLKYIKTEYKFKTNDRVDILLRDQYGRFVVVEVEPECEKNNHIGSAQCMKYRSLMRFENDRNENEVRAILAAKSISKDIADKARRYNIEIKEIDI